ncbi:hypothetical protein JCM10213_007992 [Rhodosporidiobolus nylandii]
MPPQHKRARTRSPSPQLPLHLLTSLPSSTSTSSSRAPTAGASGLRLLPAFADGVHAHEATLLPRGVYGELADELEELPSASAGGGGTGAAAEGKKGRRMVRWAGGEAGEGREVWTDRYDILHLLPSLPQHLPYPSSASPATTAEDRQRGFEHLPPDHEELFYFSAAERAALEGKRKRRRLEEEREARVRALEAREKEESAAAGEGEAENGSEPSDEQLALMKRLHTTLSTSPNPQLLELRILANHGSDARFAFLRKGGRWREVWERIRAGKDPLGREEVKSTPGGLMGLGGYGSSDEESEEEGVDEEGAKADVPQEVGESPAPSSVPPPVAAPPSAAAETHEVAAEAIGTYEVDEERMKKQREKQEKAREWARKRKEAREKAGAA